MIATLTIVFLVVFNVATVMLAERRQRAARAQIADLKQQWDAERRVVTLLRERLDAIGITTDIRPRADGFYDLSFDGRAARSIVRPLHRGPFGRTQ